MNSWNDLVDEDGFAHTSEPSGYISMCNAQGCIMRPNGLTGYCVAHEPKQAIITKLYASKSIWRVEVRCPYCRKLHRHGGGSITDKPNLGHRGSECKKGDYIIT